MAVDSCIRRYKLDDAQAERTNAILADCLDRARTCLSKHQEEIDAVAAKIKALSSNPVPENEDRLQELKQSIEKLTAPVTAIRDESLLPSLRKLPTRALNPSSPPVPSPRSLDPLIP